MHAHMHRHIYGHTRLRTDKETNIQTHTCPCMEAHRYVHAHTDTWNLKEAICLLIRQLVENHFQEGTNLHYALMKGTIK